MGGATRRSGGLRDGGARVPSQFFAPFPRGALGILVAVYIGLGTVAVVGVTLLFPLGQGLALPFSPFGLDPRIGGLLVWILVGLATASRSAVEEGRVVVVYGVGPVVAAAALGGPAAAVWVALIGSTEWREVSGRVPWYGVLANHAMFVVPAAVGGLVMRGLGSGEGTAFGDPLGLAVVMAGAACFSLLNLGSAYLTVRVRTGRGFTDAIGLPVRALTAMFVAESALGWVFAGAYELAAWWSPIVLVAADVAAAGSLDQGRASWLLRHHQLTRLPNRLALTERAGDFSRRGRLPLGVFYLDLDGFKTINDSYDHDTGDLVLQVVAERMTSAKRPDDFLAHFHGDEFVLLAPGVATSDAAAGIAERLRTAISQPIVIGDATFRVGASVGFQVVTDSDGLDAAIRAADHRMQEAKQSRRLAGAGGSSR